MNISFRRLENIPRLSWAAKVCKGTALCTVYHGPWVETDHNFFVEGAWAGDFSSGEIESSTMMGSAGRIKDGSLLVVGPSHTLDRIFTYRVHSQTLISNSLPFILSLADDNLDMTFPFYDAYMASIVRGIDSYERSIPTESGNRVDIHYYRNLEIDQDANVVEHTKQECPAFTSYEDYVEFLQSQVSLICTNAADENRNIQFDPIATISSGYDSPACAVLAKGVGCREALTIPSPRSGGISDSGKEVGDALGMAVKVVDRLAYKKRTDFPEAECAGGPSEFSSLGDDLESKIVFVGFHGDKVWDRNAKPSTTIVRGDASGFGLTELRLRVGFILLAVPFIGCTSHPSIHRISVSEAMRPWSLGNNYDRPIPRRLAESSGVARELFGVRKLATGVYVTEEGLERTMSPPSLRDFASFCEEFWNWRMAILSLPARVAKALLRVHERADRLAARISRTVLGKEAHIPFYLPNALRVQTYGYAGKEMLLFHWGIRKTMRKYTHLEESPG